MNYGKSKIEYLAIPITITLMMLSVVAGDIALLINDREYHVFFSVITLLYLFPYLYIILLSRSQPPLAWTIVFFIALKVYFLVMGNIDGSIALSDGGDAVTVHIPNAQKLTSFNDYIEHLFSVGGVYNGRLTHVLIALYSLVLVYFNFDQFAWVNIYNIAYIFNSIICIGTIFIYYRAALIYSSSIDFSRRAAWFIALNPFFILITSLPQKEPLLFFALSLFLYFLVQGKKNYIILLATLLIILFERVYMIPLLLTIVVFYGKIIKPINIILVLAGLFSVQSFIGFDMAFSMHAAHVEALTDIEGSFIEGHGLISNIIRTFFGPAFFRPFLSEYLSFPILYLSHTLLFVFYSYIALKSITNLKDIGLVIFLSYLYTLVFIPFHGTFKVFLVVSFSGLFLDEISFVKLSKMPRGMPRGIFNAPYLLRRLLRKSTSAYADKGNAPLPL
jgi:hypothetical protein